jgi:hypothetical protein
MWLALGTTALVLLVLVWDLARPRLRGVLARWREAAAERRLRAAQSGYDPGRERRAEQRARALLRSCVDEDLPQTGELLNEYCVAFPDHSRPYGSARLPDSDDVLAKWMALTADERHLIAEANMHLPGRQVDPERMRRDLLRLAGWERQRVGRADSLPAA